METGKEEEIQMGVYGRLLRYISHIKKEVAVKALLGLLISATYISQAIMMAGVVNLVWNHGERNRIFRLICFVLFLVLVRGILTRETEAYSKVLAARIKSKLRLVVLDKVYQLGPGYLNAKRSGKVTSLILDGIESLEPFFVNYVPQIITVFVSGLFVFLYLCTFDMVSSLILLISMILCVAVPMLTVPLISRNVTDVRRTAAENCYCPGIAQRHADRYF